MRLLLVAALILSIATGFDYVENVDNCDRILDCQLRQAKKAACFGAAEAIVDVSVRGGVPPFRYQWSGEGNSYEKVFFSALGGHEVRVEVVDSQGARCEQSMRLGPESPLEAEIKVERNVSCHGGHDAILNLTVTGGWGGYRFLWSGGGCTEEDVGANAGHYSVTVTDREGCTIQADAVVLQPDVLQMHISEGAVVSPLGVSIQAEVQGAKESLTFTVSRGKINYAQAVEREGKHLVLVELGGPEIMESTGPVNIRVTDTAGCWTEKEMAIPSPSQLIVKSCPEVEECVEKTGMFASMYYFCMRKIIAPLLWYNEVSCCRLAGVVSLMRQMQDRAVGTADFGAVYMAIQLGRSLSRPLQHYEQCGFSVENSVVPFLRLHSKELYDMYRSMEKNQSQTYEDFFWQSMRTILLGNENAVLQPMSSWAGPQTILTVGPFGFDNEPFFAPSLAGPSLRVISLVLKEYFFPSSMVTMAEFPWTLQVDVELAAAFIRDAIQVVGADHVVPGDSAGVLVLGKLASMIDSFDSVGNYSVVTAALGRSVSWPFKYPPAHLSKLVPGHEKFGPAEIILTESDGFHVLSPDMAKARQALKILGPRAYVKREYSEASRGVSQIYGTMVEKALSVVFPRSVGISSMDLDLKVRIFMQQEISLAPGTRPLGFRFLAVSGKILAGHVSIGTLNNLVYKTVHNKAVEKASQEFVQLTNFTGFGAAWWWQDRQGKPHLIDFNARLERHTCLNSILTQREDLECDPCEVMRRRLFEDEAYLYGIPYILRGGIEYMDPVRAMGGSPDQVRHLLKDNPNHLPWNMCRSDGKLMNLVERKVKETLARLGA